MAGFSATVNTYASKAKERNNKVIRALGLKILSRLIELSPVGDPKRWKINAAFAQSVKFTSALNAARRAKQGGRLKKGQKRKASALIQFTAMVGPKGKKTPKNVSFRQRDWAAKGYTGGRFRGNWQVTFNAPSKKALTRIDKNGSVTLAAGNAVLATLNDKVSAIYFSNNVPYARRLEFGWSKQAPNGMVRITAIEARQMIREVLGEIKSE